MAESSGNRHVVVIGSGFGGLAAAIRLQAQGMSVTILEKRDQPGGRAYVYRDQGFTFDAGPTVITAPHCIEELFEAAGRRMSDYVELLPVEPFYRLSWEDGSTFDYGGSIEETLERIRALAPGEEEGYLRFVEHSRKVFDRGYTELAHVPFLNWWKMLEVAPHLARLRADQSVYKTVSRFVRDEKLRQAFSFHSLLVGGNPFSTSSIYTLIHFLERKWGVSFPRGGTGALVRALARLFEELGGKIVYECEVDRIETREGAVSGVVTQAGIRLGCDAVVSNGDVASTYRDLLRDERRAAPARRRMERASYSMSLFLVYFGTRRQYPDLAHHTVVFGGRYREHLAEIFGGPSLPEDFSLYLHAPTRTDPSLAPEGCESFYVLSPVPHLGNAPLAWDKIGPAYADRILESLERRLLPGLRESIVTRRIFTPDDFKTQLNARFGSAFSLEPTLTQSAYFRTHNRDARIGGLYFVGAGTHPGAGLPGVINSAKATVPLVIEDFGHAREGARHAPVVARA